MTDAWELFLLFILALVVLGFIFTRESYLKRWYYSREYLTLLAVVGVSVFGMMIFTSFVVDDAKANLFASVGMLAIVGQFVLKIFNDKQERAKAIAFEEFKRSFGPRLRQIPMLDPKEIEGLSEAETKQKVAAFFEKEQATIEKFNAEFEAALPENLRDYRDLLVLRLQRRLAWRKFFHRKKNIEDIMNG